MFSFIPKQESLGWELKKNKKTEIAKESNLQASSFNAQYTAQKCTTFYNYINNDVNINKRETDEI